MWFLPLLLGVVLQIASYLLSPKAKKAKPEHAKDLEDPVAEAGMPIPVPFGSITVKGINILWFGEKATHEYQVRA
jgi:hypothetical protein